MKMFHVQRRLMRLSSHWETICCKKEGIFYLRYSKTLHEETGKGFIGVINFLWYMWKQYVHKPAPLGKLSGKAAKSK